MKKTNVWELVNKEADVIIKGIEKGEIKTRKEFQDYLGKVYNWRISDAISSIVDIYTSINEIKIPWDYETEETAE